MASQSSEEARNDMSRMINLEKERYYHLISMQDKIAKEWIVELKKEIEYLRGKQ